jgi:hypothetical protein
MFSHRTTALVPMESQMETVFIVGLIVGAGLMAAVIFGAQTWYERRYPIMKAGA